MTTAIQASPPQNFFLKLGEDVPSTIFSFLPYQDLVRFSTTSREAQGIRETVERRNIFSRITIFDRECWKKYWNAEITGEFDAHRIDAKILRQFLTFYYRFTTSQEQDGGYPCLIPVVVPHQVKIGDETKELGMQELQELVSNPSKGRFTGYTQDTDLSRVYQTTKKTNQASLVVLLQKPFYADYPWSNEFALNPCLRNQGQVQLLKNWADQKNIPCEKEPDALSLHTTLFVYQATFDIHRHSLLVLFNNKTLRTREFIQNDLNPQSPNIPEEHRRDQMMTQIVPSNSDPNIMQLRCVTNLQNNPNASLSIPIMIKFGAPVAPSNPPPPSFSLTKRRWSFIAYHYLMGAAQMLPFIGLWVTYHYSDSLINGPDAVSPEWRNYHNWCHTIGSLITILAISAIITVGFIFFTNLIVPQITHLSLTYNLGLTEETLYFVTFFWYFKAMRSIADLMRDVLHPSWERFSWPQHLAVSDEKRLQNHRGY